MNRSAASSARRNFCFSSEVRSGRFGSASFVTGGTPRSASNTKVSKPINDLYASVLGQALTVSFENMSDMRTYRYYRTVTFGQINFQGFADDPRYTNYSVGDFFGQ